ncbi:MAG: lipopolysaccharide heptosyltransferase family protein [Planctomycetota bacterium]|nr:MAG: lipopolysaccharide heptosyltransferase family protein [Planctomycetota bacterium]
MKPSIALIRLGSMGDVVQTMAVLNLFRKILPLCHITWFVESGWAELLEGHPQLDEVVVIPRKKWQKNLLCLRYAVSTCREIKHFYQKIQAKRFHYLFDFHGNLRSGILAGLVPCSRKIGLAPPLSREGSHLFLTDSISLSPWLHKTDRAWKLVETYFGISHSPVEPPLFPSFVKEEKRVRAWLQKLPNAKKILVVHPGVSRAYQIKRWPFSFYQKVLEKVLEFPDLLVLLSYGPGEEQEVRKLSQAIYHPRLVPLDWVFSIGEMVALFRRVDFFLGSDTGPLHLADALGVQTLGLYGPKNPLTYRPYFKGQWIQADQPSCIPCGHKSCKFNQIPSPCMEGITPEQVLQGIEKFFTLKEALPKKSLL